MKNALDLLKQTFTEWSEDKVPRLGAALAYYTIFSLAPLLVIAIAIAGLVFDSSGVREQILGTLNNFLGQNGADLVGGMLDSASSNGSGIIATIIGLVTLLFGASGVFAQLQDTLNTIWEVKPKEGQGIWGFVRARFLSFTMVLGVGFLLLVSLLVSTVIQAVQTAVLGSDTTFIAIIINTIVSFGVITLMFALIYKVLPDVEIAWRDVWIGAAVTSVLFLVGKYAISLYISKAAPESSYGAAGSIILMLLWVYYSAQILFLGAEFTQVYANRYGSHVKPADNAERVTEEERAQQGMPRTSDTSDSQPTGRRTPRPASGKAMTTAPAAHVQQRLQSVERQRYVMALVGFLAAVFLGVFRKGNKSSNNQL